MQIAPARLVPSMFRVRPGFEEVDYDERVHEVRRTGAEWFVAWEDDEEAIGWVIVEWSGTSRQPGYPNLRDLFVRADRRNDGIGTALIAHIEALAVDRTCRQIGLALNPTLNPRAHALYVRLGYVYDGGEAYLDGVYGGAEDWVIDLHKNLMHDREELRPFVRDGKLVIPKKHTKRLVLLDLLAQEFEPGRHYAEQEVNERLRAHSGDFVTLRRYLVDEGYLDRQAGEYWRAGGSVT
ncbi:MAG: GNAT family N-acetyltransferase [Acidimicrobiia bacterium]